MILDEEASLHPQGPDALCGAGASGLQGHGEAGSPELRHLGLGLGPQERLGRGSTVREPARKPTTRPLSA